jgi:hypothetical protein
MNKFKNVSGLWLTKSLLIETDYNDDEAMFTSKEEHLVRKGKTFFSLHQLYLEESDPTEYEFAKKHIGGWSHWKRLQKSPAFMTLITAMREELEVKLRSQGVKSMIEEVSEQGKGALQAAKFLADRGWTEKTKGAPTKAEVKKAAKLHAQVTHDTEEDWERIQPTVKH